MAAPAEPCLRCGDFVAAPVIAGLPLCARCLEAREPTGKDDLPPRELWLRQIGCPVAGSLLAVAALCFAGFASAGKFSGTPAPLLGILILSVVLAVVAAWPVALVAIFFFASSGHGALRRRVFDELGLRDEDERWALAYSFEEREGFWLQGTLRHTELGAAAIVPGGVVFLGRRGTRRALGAGQVFGATRRLRFIPPRPAVMLTPTSGLAFLGRSFFEASRAAKEAEKVLSARMAAPVVFGPFTREPGEHGLMVATLALASKKDALVALVASIRGCSREEAAELCRSAVVPVLKQVSRATAEEARARFAAIGFVARVTDPQR